MTNKPDINTMREKLVLPRDWGTMNGKAWDAQVCKIQESVAKINKR